MSKIKIALAFALGFIGEDKFYKGMSFLLTLAIQWAVKTKRYAWLKSLARRIVNLGNAILNALEDDKVDAEELEEIIAATKALAQGNMAGDTAIEILVEEQDNDKKAN